MDDLGRTFLDLAVERGLLKVDGRDQVEAGGARAQREEPTLTPWRAAFVRGLLSRTEVDAILAAASKQVEERDGNSSIGVYESNSSEALDNRLGVLALQARVVSEDQLEIAV